jgi:hypothetical protein
MDAPQAAVVDGELVECPRLRPLAQGSLEGDYAQTTEDHV